MSFKCPHCGSALEVMKCEDLTKAQPVSKPEGDLASGIVEATAAAIEKQVGEVSGTEVAVNSLAMLNNLANGNLGDSESGLASGWGGAMVEALKARREEDRSAAAYAPETLAQSDPENLDKDAVAKTVQNMIHGALCKES